MALNCEDALLNLGVSQCKKLPQLIKGMITTPQDYTITADLAANSTQWQSDILAADGARIYLWPKAVSYENISEEQIIEETPITAMGVRPGQYRFRLMFRENLELHKAMYSHRNSSGRVFFIDNENKLLGTSTDDGVTLKGLLYETLLTEKIMFNDGSVVSKTPVSVYLSDNTEIDENGYMIEVGSFLSNLKSLTSVTLATTGTPTASEIVVTVKSALDGIGIGGLVDADFVVENGAISGVVEGALGVYTITGTTFATGTLDLVSAASLSVPGYESTGPVTITI